MPPKKKHLSRKTRKEELLKKQEERNVDVQPRPDTRRQPSTSQQPQQYLIQKIQLPEQHIQQQQKNEQLQQSENTKKVQIEKIQNPKFKTNIPSQETQMEKIQELDQDQLNQFYIDKNEKAKQEQQGGIFPQVEQIQRDQQIHQPIQEIHDPQIFFSLLYNENFPEGGGKEEIKEFFTAFFSHHLIHTHQNEGNCSDCSTIPGPFTCSLRCAFIHSHINNIYFWLHNPINEYFLHGSYLDGFLPQHIAAMFPTPLFLKMIKNIFVDLEVRNFNQDTPLMIAIKHGHRETVDYLLMNHASPNIANLKGETPLMIALKNDRFDIAVLLYKNHASLLQTYVNPYFNLETTRDYLGDYIYRSETSPSTNDSFPKDDEVEESNHESFRISKNAEEDSYYEKNLMDSESEFESELNQDTEDYQNFIRDINYSSDLESVEDEENMIARERLLKKKEEICIEVMEFFKQDNFESLGFIYDYEEITDCEGSTLLHIAALGYKIKILKYLYDYCLEINAVNIYKDTPLHVALESFSEYAAWFFILVGADFQKENMSGLTPLELSVAKNYFPLCEHMLTFGPQMTKNKEMKFIFYLELLGLNKVEIDDLFQSIPKRYLQIKHFIDSQVEVKMPKRILSHKRRYSI